MKKINVAATVLVSMILSACGGGGGGSSTQTPPVAQVPVSLPILNINDQLTKSANADTLGFEPANMSHTSGELQTNTGFWGVKSASAYYENVVGTIDPNTNIANVTFNWDITSSQTPGVVNFSNITYGLHPGSAFSTTKKLPVRVTSMGDQVVNADVKTSCETTCSYQTMLDVFVMSSNSTSNADIGTEIVILTDRNIGPSDLTGETATIGGVTYKVVHNGFITNWNAIQYFAPIGTPINSMKINVKDFVNDALQRGWIKSTDYLVSIELGTEVIQGKGKTEIKNLHFN
jgi:hypothetical protein